MKMPSGEVPVSFVGFQWNLNFLNRFSNKAQISSFIKIRLVGAELFHADGQTGMKLILAFRYFASAPKKCHVPAQFPA
jgi:hypothetical protein